MVKYAVTSPDDQNGTGSGTGAGTGYQVDLPALQAAAAAAMSISQDVSALADKVGPAISIGAQGGLQIGVAVGQAQAPWTNQLTSLSGLIAGAGANLQSCADSYSQTEGAVTDSMTIGRTPTL